MRTLTQGETSPWVHVTVWCSRLNEALRCLYRQQVLTMASSGSDSEWTERGDRSSDSEKEDTRTLGEIRSEA